jgi:hypothetical protein
MLVPRYAYRPKHPFLNQADYAAKHNTALEKMLEDDSATCRVKFVEYIPPLSTRLTVRRECDGNCTPLHDYGENNRSLRVYPERHLSKLSTPLDIGYLHASRTFGMDVRSSSKLTKRI